MKKNLLLVVLISCIAKTSFSQCTGTALNWVNPSFEGTPGTPHVTPPNWDICQPGTTPDTQPGCWGVTLAPSNGISYVGFCNQSGWEEGCSQTLSSPMVPGTTYTFDLDLATTASTVGGLTPGCIEMCIYGNMGGNSGCDMSEQVWCSGDIYNAPHIDQWVTHTVSFVPTQAWTHLLFMSRNLGCALTPYMMMDNLTPVMPIADVPQFTWSNVCFGDTMIFTDSSTSIGTITTWNWDYGDGSPPDTTQNPSHNYVAAGTYIVTLTITSTVPCTTTVTHAVTVYPSVTSPFNLQSPLCLGVNTTITYNGNADTAAIYSWNFDSANVVTGSGQGPYVVNWSSPGVHNVTLSVTVGSCQSPLTTIPVLVTNLISAATVLNNDSCYGAADGSAIVATSGGIPPFNYTWSPSGGNGATAAGLSAGQYIVYVTDSSGCQSEDTVYITEPLALTGIITPLDVHCSNNCDGVINLNMSGGTAPYIYQWSNGQVTQNISNLCAGNYSVTISDVNNCLDTLNAIINTSSPITASFTADQIEGVVPFTINLTYTGSSAASYLWDFGDNSTSTSQNPSHTYTSQGSFIIILIVSMGPPDFCTDTVQLTVQVEDPSYIIVPNVFTPNNDGYNDVFEISSKGLASLECTVFNRWGKPVGEFNSVNGNWDGINMNDKKPEPDGVYYYVLKAGGKDNKEYNYQGTITLLR